MAHYSQRQFVGWVKEAFPACFADKKVLEVGSLDINGSVRDFFDRCEYTGLDVGPGPGVDVVCGGQEYDAPDASFDVVCSFEAMEHNPYWKETFANMLRMAKPGALVLMSCATYGRPEHGTSCSKPADSPLTAQIGWDYYRNLSAKEFGEAFDLSSELSGYATAHYYFGHDLFLVGFRAGTPAPKQFSAFRRQLRWRYVLRNFLNKEAFQNMWRVRIGGQK